MLAGSALVFVCVATDCRGEPGSGDGVMELPSRVKLTELTIEGDSPRLHGIQRVGELIWGKPDVSTDCSQGMISPGVESKMELGYVRYTSCLFHGSSRYHHIAWVDIEPSNRGFGDTRRRQNNEHATLPRQSSKSRLFD